MEFEKLNKKRLLAVDYFVVNCFGSKWYEQLTDGQLSIYLTSIEMEVEGYVEVAEEAAIKNDFSYNGLRQILKDKFTNEYSNTGLNE